MSDNVKQDHYDLLHKIERNDRLFRIAQTVFMSIIGLVLVLLVLGQFYVIKQFQDQSRERASGLQQVVDSANHNTELSNQYLQCIARFFAATDRQDRVLTDLDRCIYEENGRVIPGLGDGQTTSVVNSPAPISGENGPSDGGGAGDSDTPVTPEEPQNQPPILEVDPIEVCLPLVDLCIVL